ncbi:MAG TPA: hypothetical protein VN441_04260 [Syntrophomonas sp.]|nr:hypothetical protein [Syntrophomonas sp.]
MPREPDGYREQLEYLTERYPDRDMLSIQEACKIFKCGRHKLLNDRTFPVKQFDGKGTYYIPIPGLARWMTTH